VLDGLESLKWLDVNVMWQRESKPDGYHECCPNLELSADAGTYQGWRKAVPESLFAWNARAAGNPECTKLSFKG
jgi:hypothetical protein